MFVLGTHCPPGTKNHTGGRCIQDIPYNRPGVPDSGLTPSIPATVIDPRVAHLGRWLFFDPILSDNKKMSCAHCHHPALGWSDGQAVSRGRGAVGVGLERTGGKALRRAAPGLWNVSFQKRLFWDGRATTLEHQAEEPLFHPSEMRTSRHQLASRLQSDRTYPQLFRAAFGKAGNRINTKLVLRALAEFQRTLISFNSRYDRYVLGDRDALTKQELHGFNVYRSFITRCAECHVPPLFTNQQDAAIGAPDPDGLPFDAGIEELTGSSLMRGSFRIPSLRNVGRTAPYMHSGGLPSLEAVVDFYDAGGGRAQDAPYKDVRIHWHIRKIGLSDEEKLALVAFLRTLTDESAMPSIPSSVPSGLPVLDGGKP